MKFTQLWLAAGFFCAAPLVWPQHVVLHPAPHLQFPGPVDSNSPAFWMNNELVLYNSTGQSLRSTGANQFNLQYPAPVILGPSIHHPYWIEATYVDETGTVFAWYHHEPGGVCGKIPLTAPQIGALVSHDGGRSFVDLGVILQNAYGPDCSAQNGYFAGGNGDFSVILGRNKKYFYFLFSNYGGPLEEQGVALARLPIERRENPYGAVAKYYQGQWLEPGIGGHVTPIFPAKAAWSRPDADAFWGPSVHWNTYLKTFVVLLNHACCTPGWPQEGVYVSYNPSLSNPKGWTAPEKIIDAGWYPQVLGYGTSGTDKQAGRTARFYSFGISDWEIEFQLPDSPPPQQ